MTLPLRRPRVPVAPVPLHRPPVSMAPVPVALLPEARVPLQSVPMELAARPAVPVVSGSLGPALQESESQPAATAVIEFRGFPNGPLGVPPRAILLVDAGDPQRAARWFEMALASAAEPAQFAAACLSTAPARLEPMEPDSLRAEPLRVETLRAEPLRVETLRAEPLGVEPQGPETQGPETQGPETRGPETRGVETPRAKVAYRYRLALAASGGAGLRLRCWRYYGEQIGWQRRCGPMALGAFVAHFGAKDATADFRA